MQPNQTERFADKRVALREEFLARHFLLGGWIGGTDTYERTMWAAVPDVALVHAGYSLTMRHGLPEPGAGDRLVMAGHEAMLAQWFYRPLLRSDIRLAEQWFKTQATTRAFPRELWRSALDAQSGDEIHLPVDVRVSPGGRRSSRACPACRSRARAGSFPTWNLPCAATSSR